MANFSPDEAQKIIDEYNQKLADGETISADLAKQMKDASIGIKDYTDKLKNSIDNLKTQTVKLGGKLVDGESGLSVYNDVTLAAGDAMGDWVAKLPKFGKALSGVTKTAAEYAVLANKQADTLFQSYQSISRSGLVTGMQDTFKNLEAAGYTVSEIKEYGDLLKGNATTLAIFGGTAAEGAKQFTEVSAAIKDSDLETQFMQMGMTVGDINAGTLNYIKIQQMSGSSRVQSTTELKDSTKDYLEQQDRLTKLTGLNAKQQTDAYEKLLKTSQYGAHVFELQQIAAKGGKEGEAALARIAKEREIIVEAGAKGGQHVAEDIGMTLSGAINSEGHIRMTKAFPETTKALQSGILSSGETINLLTKESITAGKRFSGLGTVGAASKNLGQFNEILKLNSASTVDMSKADKKARTDQATQAKGAADESTKNMVKLTQSQRNITQDLDHGINAGIETVSTGFVELTKAAREVAGAGGQLAGKEGRIGGGPTLIDRAKGLFGGAPSSGAGSAAARVEPTAPAPSTSAAPAAPAPTATPASTAPAAPSPAVPAPVAPTAPAVTAPSPTAPTAPAAPVSAAPTGKESSLVTGMDAIKQMIIRHEGLKTRPYQDSLGLWTVGVGHLIGDGKSLPAGMNREFSKDEVMAMFEKDFAHHFSLAQMTPGWDKASEVARGAMVDLAFNMGQWWKKFPNTAKALAAGDWAGAAAGLRDSKWASQVKGRASTIIGMIEQGGSAALGGGKKSFATGGVASGPTSGYQATLHGNEAVVPLPDGKTIPVQMSGSEDSGEELTIIARKIGTLDLLISSMQKHSDLSRKILQRQS